MTRAAAKKAGHWWLWGADVRGLVLRRALVRVHRVYGRGPFETVEESPLLAADLATCGTCGLVTAELVVVDPYDGAQRTLHAELQLPKPASPDFGPDKEHADG